MEKIKSLILPLILFPGYLYFLHYSLPTTAGSIPPLGPFFNPFSGFWQNAESTEQNKIIDLEELGVSAAASIYFDERLVPHIFASNELDLALIQGYLHARYRLWQMDITARQASGRLAEVFGERLLENDKRMRRMGLAKTAHRSALKWEECSDFRYLEKYVAGVNYYIENLLPRNYPAEFKLFNYQPEPWTIEKTAQVVMSMNLMLCGRNEDLAATNSLALLGRETFEELYPRWNPKQSPIIPSDVEWKFEAQQESQQDQLIGFRPERMIHAAPRYVGSNNWVVNAQKTLDGFPILCNDPHLSLTLPSIWYEMQMKSPNTNVYGVSLPGIPHIAIGFNEKIAWGETNVGIDVSDLYEIQWTEETQSKYRYDDREVEVTREIETFHIKNQAPAEDTIKYTLWGPVIFEEGRSLALKWLPNLVTENCIIASFQQLNQSTNFDQYYHSLQGFKSPAQNFAFASQEGDIALKVQGAFPIKGRDQGQFILAGSSSENDWQGYIPFDQTPFVLNPSRGFVASANQNSTDTTYPYPYHGYFDDFRGRTLNRELTKMEHISIDDMKTLQNSTFDLSAAELLPVLIEMVKNNSENTSWLEDLEGWDFRYEANGTAPIKYELWKQYFYDLTWDEFAVAERDQHVEMLFPELWMTIQLATEHPDHKYFDIAATPERESAADLAALSLASSMADYDSVLAVHPKLDWKTYRPVTVNHLSRIAAFSETGIEVGGTVNALNSIKGTHGPSWRMIVQLSDPVKAWGIYPGGQSGNPGSPYYKNMIADWAKGHYYELHFALTPEDLTDYCLFRIQIKS